jgi:hypothetical protein
MLDRLEMLLARALKRRAESVLARPLNIHQVRQRARRLLVAGQLAAVFAMVILFGIVWWLHRV